jgi:hypothetical protein
MPETSLDAAGAGSTAIASLFATFAALAGLGASSSLAVSDPPGRHFVVGRSCEVPGTEGVSRGPRAVGYGQVFIGYLATRMG